MKHLTFTVPLLFLLVVSLATSREIKQDGESKLADKGKSTFFARMKIQSLRPKALDKISINMLKKDDNYFYRKINDRLCEPSKELANRGDMPVQQAKEYLFKIESQSINRINSNLGFNTSDIQLINNLRELLRPQELDDELLFCGIEATQTLGSIWKKLKAFDSSRREDKHKKCNRIADIYNYYIDRRLSICPERYLELFHDYQVDYNDMIRLVKLNFAETARQLTGVASVEEYSLDQVMNSRPRTNKHLSETMADKGTIFKGMISAFVDFKQHNLDDPFVYVGANEQVAGELLYRFQLSPCQRYLRNFKHVYGSLNLDLDASKELNKDISNLFTQQPVPPEFYYDWLLYDICGVIVPEDDNGQYIMDGYEITPNMLMDLVHVMPGGPKGLNKDFD